MDYENFEVLKSHEFKQKFYDWCEENDIDYESCGLVEKFEIFIEFCQIKASKI